MRPASSPAKPCLAKALFLASILRMMQGRHRLGSLAQDLDLLGRARHVLGRLDWKVVVAFRGLPGVVTFAAAIPGADVGLLVTRPAQSPAPGRNTLAAVLAHPCRIRRQKHDPFASLGPHRLHPFRHRVEVDVVLGHWTTGLPSPRPKDRTVPPA